MSVLRLAGEPAAEVAVVQAGLACCSLEIDSAVAAGELVAVAADPRSADLVLIAGTITEAMREPLAGLLAGLRPDARIVAFGACATSGGPYWDAPMVVPGFDALGSGRPVAQYVPGCPPTPGALAAALRGLAASPA